jgi:hypothetical protein
MKRSEEIKKEAVFRYPEMTSRYIAFIKGAKYADRTMLDRACSVFSDILIEICPELLGYGAGAKAWENKFRKRLEGGAE